MRGGGQWEENMKKWMSTIEKKSEKIVDRNVFVMVMEDDNPDNEFIAQKKRFCNDWPWKVLDSWKLIIPMTILTNRNVLQWIAWKMILISMTNLLPDKNLRFSQWP